MKTNDKQAHGSATGVAEMHSASFFVSGGTMAVDASSYAERSADKALYGALLAHKYCYVLNSRQMGKSSLCVRTKAKLEGQGVRTAFVDLTRIGGVNVSPEQWYAGLIGESGRAIGAKVEMLQYWKEHAHLGPMQRFFGALREAALEMDSNPIVIFLDEIDATLNLSFETDEFFAGIRECFNRRVHEPAYCRLTFCLIGVAVPNDLIANPRTTPFNIGERIYLRDFTLEELSPFAHALGANGSELIARVHYWTNGHPFLTQSICASIARNLRIRSARDVDDLVAAEFLRPGARDTSINLADVANRAVNAFSAEPDADRLRADLLSAYRRALRGGRLADDESNRVNAYLKLSGLMRSDNQRLLVRNRIYERVFDRSWVRENMPGQEIRRQKAAFRMGMVRTGGIAAVVLGAIGFLAVRNSQLAKVATLSAAHERQARLESDRLRAQAEKFSYQAYVVTLANADEAFNKREYGKALRILKDLEEQPQRGWELSYLANRFHRVGRFFQAHTGRIKGMCFLPDGTLATVGIEGSLALWDAETGGLVRRVSLASDARYIAPGMDSRHVAIGYRTGEIKWIDLETNLSNWEVHGDYSGLNGIVTSPDRKRLFAYTDAEDGRACVYSTGDGRAIHKFALGKVYVEAAAWSEDGKYLAISSMAPSILRLYRSSDWSLAWSAEGGLDPKEPKTTQSDDFCSLSFDHEGQRLLTGGRSGRVFSFDQKTGRRTLLRDANLAWTYGIHPLPGGDRWATSSLDSTLAFWDQGFKGAPALRLHQHPIWVSVLSPDGSKLATTGVDGGVYVWNVPKPGESLESLSKPWAKLPSAAEVSELAASPDGSLLVALVGGPDQGPTSSIFALRASDGSVIWKREDNPPDSERIVFAPDGGLVASGLGDGLHTVVYRAADGHEVARLDCADALGFSRDGSRFAGRARSSVTRDPRSRAFGALVLYDTSTWNRLAVRTLTDRIIRTVDFSPDGEEIAVALTDLVVYLVDGTTLAPLRRLRGHSNELLRVRYSEDGTRLYSTGFDMTVLIWDVTTSREAQIVVNPSEMGACDAIEILGSEDRLAVGATNGIYVIDPNAGRRLLTIPIGNGNIAYARSGALFVGGTLGRIFRLDAPPIPRPRLDDGASPPKNDRP